MSPKNCGLGTHLGCWSTNQMLSSEVFQKIVNILLRSMLVRPLRIFSDCTEVHQHIFFNEIWQVNKIPCRSTSFTKGKAHYLGLLKIFFLWEKHILSKLSNFSYGKPLWNFFYGNVSCRKFFPVVYFPGFTKIQKGGTAKKI